MSNYRQYAFWLARLHDLDPVEPEFTVFLNPTAKIALQEMLEAIGCEKLFKLYATDGLHSDEMIVVSHVESSPIHPLADAIESARRTDLYRRRGEGMNEETLSAMDADDHYVHQFPQAPEQDVVAFLDEHLADIQSRSGDTEQHVQLKGLPPETRLPDELESLLDRLTGSLVRLLRKTMDSLDPESDEEQEVSVRLPDDDPLHLPALLMGVGLASSTSAGRHDIDTGLVRIDGIVVAPRDYEHARTELVGRVVSSPGKRAVRFIECDSA